MKLNPNTVRRSMAKRARTRTAIAELNRQLARSRRFLEQTRWRLALQRRQWRLYREAADAFTEAAPFPA